VIQLPVNYFCEDYLCNDPDLINVEILSPEILDGELISTIGGKNKSVVWSLGVLLYELLTESKPYLLGAARCHWKYHGHGGSQEVGSGTDKKILRKYIQDGMVGLYESIVSERMVHLLRRMLTVNPGNRPNLIDVKIELATFLQDEAGIENIVGGVSKNLPGSNEFVPKSEFMKNRMLNLKDRLAKIPEPEPPKKVSSMIEENEVSEYSWKDSGFSESRDDRKSNLKSYVTPDDFDDDEYDFDSDVEEPPAFGGNDRGSFGVRAGVQYVGSDVRYSEGP
jgi:serine/threonine protein kinase